MHLPQEAHQGSVVKIIFGNSLFCISLCTTKTLMKYAAEPVIWTIALLLLFFLDPSSQSISFCLFRFIGLQFCFGCGIGHAIHYVLHLEFKQSFQEHMLGIPAAIGILYTILKSVISEKKPLINEPATNANDVT